MDTIRITELVDIINNATRNSVSVKSIKAKVNYLSRRSELFAKFSGGISTNTVSKDQAIVIAGTAGTDASIAVVHYFSTSTTPRSKPHAIKTPSISHLNNHRAIIVYEHGPGYRDH